MGYWIQHCDLFKSVFNITIMRFLAYTIVFGVSAVLVTVMIFYCARRDQNKI
jgi:hypothetical protein